MSQSSLIFHSLAMISSPDCSCLSSDARVVAGVFTPFLLSVFLLPEVLLVYIFFVLDNFCHFAAYCASVVCHGLDGD